MENMEHETKVKGDCQICMWRLEYFSLSSFYCKSMMEFQKRKLSKTLEP